ncbi:hypothetical protein [Streptomyces sp. NPDC053048]|uniref:hypothetical protein n=1 Tax=Streptomyces sp. NPDC053048 TaxID=3365694 RepID=UPI0037CEEC6C
MGIADNSDQQHMRRMTLDYSYEQLNGLLTTLQLAKEESEREAEASSHPHKALAHRLLAQWTSEHIDRLQAAWEAGEPLEERAESSGVTLTGVTGVGSVHVFSEDLETYVTIEEQESEASVTFVGYGRTNGDQYIHALTGRRTVCGTAASETADGPATCPDCLYHLEKAQERP